MDPSMMSAVRRGLQRPWYGQTLVQNGALRTVSRQARAPTESPVRTYTCTEGALWAVAVRRGHPQRPRYGQTLVQNGALRAVGRQPRAPTETPVRTDTCTEWSPPGCQPSGEGTHRDPGTGCQPSDEGSHRDPGTDRHLYSCTEWSPLGCQPSGEGTHRDPGTDRHLYRMEPSGLSGEGHRDPGTDRHLYRMELSAVRRGHPQTPVTDRHLYRMEPSGLSAVRRGHPQRLRYGQTLVHYGALQAVSHQARAPTETAVRTDTCTEWSPPGCEPSGEGTHRDPSMDRHLYRMEPSGLSAVRQGHPQRPWYGLSAVRRGHPQRPRYGLSAVRPGPQRPRYGQTLVQNGALWAVSLQARAPTETLVRTDTCIEWSPLGCQLSGEGTHRDPSTGCQPSGEGTHRDPGMGFQPPGEGTHRDPGTGCQPSVEGHRDPGTDRHLYRMEPSGLSAFRRGHPQRPCRQVRATETPVRTDTCTEWSCQLSGEGTHRDPGTGCEPSGRAPTETPVRAVSRQTRTPTETLVRAVSRQARAPTETPVQTDTCTEWTPPGCQLSGEGYRDPGTDRHLYRMEPCGLSAVRRGHPQRPRYGLSAFRRGHSRRPRYGQTLVQNGAVSRQARAPTETPVRAVSRQAGHPRRPRYVLSAVRRVQPQRPWYGL
ncbi:hypothetical protein NDU88_006723 [Pleurodeles waltl]|uniref:Uncharacterized protein n=1 Tax=Pleurodeles waltl TaxID=8319 RepID=A0AAV7L4Z0_PLEWA|nr:hypothetical protein NDU88_006723 [Pleurodeles waltl]